MYTIYDYPILSSCKCEGYGTLGMLRPYISHICSMLYVNLYHMYGMGWYVWHDCWNALFKGLFKTTSAALGESGWYSYALFATRKQLPLMVVPNLSWRSVQIPKRHLCCIYLGFVKLGAISLDIGRNQATRRCMKKVKKVSTHCCRGTRFAKIRLCHVSEVTTLMVNTSNSWQVDMWD